MSLQIIILAAGLGKRMQSDLPKVLHAVAGKPMLQHVIETAQKLNPDRIHVLHGHHGDKLKAALTQFDVNWVYQDKQLGTGHAVAQVLPHLPDLANVLVLSGDVPMIKASTLENVASSNNNESLTLLCANFDNPFGLGRIVRDSDSKKILGIVEERDASIDQRQISEIYSGILCAPVKSLKQWLPRLSNDNSQGEYYLTEIIGMAVKEKMTVNSCHVIDNIEVKGVNDRLQLHELERMFQRRSALKLMQEGVTIFDSERLDIRGDLNCGRDVSIDVNCIFEGKVVIGDGVKIGPNCYFKDVTIEKGSVIAANSVLEDSHIGPECQIGPFARIRPQTELAAGCKVGNFVEMKKTKMAQESKASHLSYLGDADIGAGVNIGAGTITCNYDGVNKYRTVIEDGAFIGSDTQLVAPVTVGRNAIIGAGTTLRKNAPAHELTLSENRQKVLSGWKRQKKEDI